MKLTLILFGIAFTFLNVCFGLIIIFNDNQNATLWADFSALATVDIALLTIFIVFFGGFQFIATKEQAEETKENNKNILAHTAYSEYLKLTLQYPDFAHPEASEIIKNYKVYNQYRWYIANMLFHFEEVLLAVGNDKDWETTLKYQIEMHSWHICRNDNYKTQGWDEKLENLIGKVTLKNRKYASKTNNFLVVADDCKDLYQQYLALILNNHTLLKPEANFYISLANSNEYKIFLKSTLYILGELLETSGSNVEWIKTVRNELINFEWYFNTVKVVEQDMYYFTSERHKKIICEQNRSIRLVYG